MDAPSAGPSRGPGPGPDPGPDPSSSDPGPGPSSSDPVPHLRTSTFDSRTVPTNTTRVTFDPATGTMHFRADYLETETVCLVCKSVLRETRVVIPCMHRFCKDCIEFEQRNTSGRTAVHGKKKGGQCPQCRHPIPSRRHTKPDPAFDALLAAIYGDVEAYNNRHELAGDDMAELMRLVQANQAQLMAAFAKREGVGGGDGPPTKKAKRRDQDVVDRASTILASAEENQALEAAVLLEMTEKGYVERGGSTFTSALT